MGSIRTVREQVNHRILGMEETIDQLLTALRWSLTFKFIVFLLTFQPFILHYICTPSLPPGTFGALASPRLYRGCVLTFMDMLLLFLSNTDSLFSFVSISLPDCNTLHMLFSRYLRAFLPRFLHDSVQMLLTLRDFPSPCRFSIARVTT